MSAVLRAGGYVLPTTVVSDEVPVDTIDARIFRHPAIPGREVVRLTPSNLAQGEDAAMDILGYGVDSTSANVALRMRQALGFPAWVLVHDPKNASSALSIARELKKEARRAKSKPGNSKIAFDAMGAAIAAKTPHFLPSFYEEVARAFIESGNTTYAASYFGKAREAEQAYTLEVDETRRRDAFVEFALAGALTNKVMTDYARDLANRHGDELAYEYFFDLCVRRTLGGTPPHAQMVTELRKLAKSASRKQAEEDRRFILSIWEAPALPRAAAKFWEIYEKAYVEVCKDDPRIRGRLVNTFPQVSGKSDGFKAFWVTFLKNTGADSGLTLLADEVEAAARPEGSAAQWLAKFIGHRTSSGYSYYRQLTTPDEGFELVRRMSKRLVADGQAIVFESASWYSQVDVDIVDLLLELGIPVNVEGMHFDLNVWATSIEDSSERRRELKYIGQDSRFDDMMDAAVGAVFGQAAFENAARGKVGLKAAREKWLKRRVTELQSGAMPAFQTQSSQLRNVTSSATFAEFPQPWKDLHDIDIVGPLGRTLRGGFLGELTWQDAVNAQKELEGAAPIQAVSVVMQFPYLILHNAHRAIVVGPNGRELEHDFKLPKDKSPNNLRFAGGQLLVVFYDQNWQLNAYWSGKPTHVFPGGYLGWGSTICIPRRDGSIVEGSVAYRAGDETMPRLDFVIGDGETFWTRQGWGDDAVYLEFDPETGKTGRASNPAYFEDNLPDNYKIARAYSEIYPLPESLRHSLMGSTPEGLYAHAVYTDESNFVTITPNGRVDFYADSLFRMPGSDTLRILADGFNLILGEETVDTTVGLCGIAITNRNFAHYLRPADEAASAKLRNSNDDFAATLLVAAILRALAEEELKSTLLATWLERLRPLVAPSAQAIHANFDLGLKRLLGESVKVSQTVLDDTIQALLGCHETFRLGLVRQLQNHAAYAIQLALHIETNNPETAESVAVQFTDSEIWAYFGDVTQGNDYRFYNYTWGAQQDLVNYVKVLSKFFQTGEEPKDFAWVSTDFAHLLQGMATMGWLAASPGLETDRETLLSFIEVVANSGLLDLPGKMRVFNTVKSDWAPYGVDPAWVTFIHSVDGHRYFGKGAYWSSETIRVVEYAPDGDFKLPAGCTVSDEIVVTKWSGDAARRLVQLVRERGAYPVSVELAKRLAEKAGVSQAEASLIWTCLPGLSRYDKNFMPKELRETLGLKVAESAMARDSLKQTSVYGKISVYGAGFPEDPAVLWDHPEAAVDELAACWRHKFGARATLPEQLLADLKKDLGMWDPRPVLGHILDLKSSAYGVVPEMEFSVVDNYLYFNSKNGEQNPLDNLWTFMRVVSYVVLNTTDDDPVRLALPAAAKVWERTLADKRYWVSVSHVIDVVDYNKVAETFARLGPNKSHKGHEYYQDDLVMLWPGRYNIDCVLNVSAFLAGKTSRYFADTRSLSAASEIFSERFKRLMASIEAGSQNVGQFGANPKNSAPDLVGEVAKALEISENAAIAFLQILTLSNPTSANVKTWTGWSSAIYKKAVDELAAKGLVLEAKRARAGRSHFLDGPWLDLKAPRLPVEAWKNTLYDLEEGYGDWLPKEPLGDLFARAWKRWESGDRPKF